MVLLFKVTTLGVEAIFMSIIVQNGCHISKMAAKIQDGRRKSVIVHNFAFKSPRKTFLVSKHMFLRVLNTMKYIIYISK